MAKREQLQDKVLRSRRVTREFDCFGVSHTASTSKGQLKAQYASATKQWRIVYVANGLWQLQTFAPPDGAIGANGDKTHGSYWQGHKRATTYEHAHNDLKRRDRLAA